MDNCLNLVIFVEKKLHSGNCSVQIGKILLDRQAWGDAARALKKGIKKGDLDDLEEASTLLQRCHDSMADSESAENP